MNLQISARKLAAIAVSGAVVVVGGSAFAEELMPPDPVVVEEVEVEEVEVEDVETEEVETEEVEVEDVETEEDTTVEAHPDNHGAAVSEAAHASTPEAARNHGEAVSAVARSNAGKPEGRGNGHKADK